MVTIHNSLSLDTDQSRAVAHSGGPALVLAGPGSGKTRTLAARVAHLLQNCRPRDVLCVTFSVAAAEEMRRRVAALTAAELPKAMFSTFHSAALRILYCEKQLLPWKPAANMVLETTGAKQVLRELGVPKEAMAAVRRDIARLRRSLVDAESSEGIYNEYDAALQEAGVVDFPAMVYWAVRQIENNAYSAAHWMGAYRHVLVDEAHDASPDQMRFAKLLSRDGGVMIFGDDSQAIYSWRGSDPRILKDFQGEVYVLGNNYRSGSRIVESFRPLAEEGLLADTMRATILGGAVENRREVSDEVEAQHVSESLSELLTRGAKPESLSVLARTRALLAPIADELDRREISYSWRGRNFWTTREVQDVLAWLRVARHPGDRESLRKAILSSTEATKYLGKKFAIAAASVTGPDTLPERVPGEWKISQWRRWYEMADLIRGIGSTPIDKPALWVRMVLALFEDRNGDEEPDDFRWENMQQLALRAAHYETIDAFLERAQRAEENKANGVALSTIHAAKGLEWDAVFVIGVSKGLLPHRKAEDLEEERRVLYVAMSRARRRLVLSGAGEPSPLLERIYDSQTEVRA